MSYYHHDDEYYRHQFDLAFGELFITKSVQPGDIDTDNSDEYIARLIREGYLQDTSVVLVLVGPKTKCRKHVDWEIAAGLHPSGGRTGLVGVLLPEFPLNNNQYDPDDLPKRLDDNVRTGFASLTTWANIVADGGPTVSRIINEAFDRRLDDTVTNGRPKMPYNTCS